MLLNPHGAAQSVGPPAGDWKVSGVQIPGLTNILSICFGSPSLAKGIRPRRSGAAVESPSADRKVPGSNPGVEHPFDFK